MNRPVVLVVTMAVARKTRMMPMAGAQLGVGEGLDHLVVELGRGDREEGVGISPSAASQAANRRTPSWRLRAVEAAAPASSRAAVHSVRLIRIIGATRFVGHQAR